ncbi:tripartite tricarboxylate transporter substrate binding protein [Roseomonas sp. NAR14]|uniref:Tripartite tricarboxylate transporter substrate binding protein n=1 Tax=Roseomonas acroporae TaxID=2937791 RepID=A0A9X2BZD0_9PROT|nr:tripartite tricarboxylate transporter substrate binding protein [Roseomonas acroporae]MCK8787874.1 tripartite tricarboxylate transporter substrate binding protein [Roseomonas acroporae]
MRADEAGMAGTGRVSRRTALGTLGLGTLGLGAPGLGLSSRALAQGQAAWPSRPVTLIVGFPPGGQTDFAARVIQPGLSAALGQPVVIDNRGGAGGNLGTEAVLRARPDGYTLLAGNSSPIAINPHTFPGMTINPLDLASIGLSLKSPMVLCVHPSVPARNVAELTAWIKAQSGGVDYGTPAAGSLSHCAMELFRSRIGGPPMENIPYRGSGPAIQDFIAGRFNLMFDGASVVAPFVKAGQLRALLVTGTERSPAFPDVPTATEQGLRDFVFYAWIGLFAPKGTPAEIIAKANAALNTAVRDPQARERVVSQGDDIGGGTPEEFAAMVRRDHAMWGEVVRANNITAG